MTLGNRIRNRREELGMSQQELAETARLSQSSISQIEAELFMPRESTLIVLSLALQLPPEELLGSESRMAGSLNLRHATIRL